MPGKGSQLRNSLSCPLERLKEIPNMEHPAMSTSSAHASRKRRRLDAEDTTVPTKRMKLQTSSYKQEVTPAQRNNIRDQSFDIAKALSETATDLLMTITRLTKAIERLCFFLATDLVSKIVKDVCAAVNNFIEGVELLQTLLPNHDTIPATSDSTLGNTTVTAQRDDQRRHTRKSKQLSGTRRSSRIQSTSQAAEIWGAAEDEVLRALTPGHLADGRRLQERFGFEILVERIQEMLYEYNLA